jgi:hypothetical protein
MRVPFIVHFPGRVPGDEYHGQALLRPTGKSLLPLVQGQVEGVHGQDEAIGFEGSGSEAIFMGDYKLTRNGPPYGDGTWRLINLRDDPTESRDLSAIEPERFKKMLAEVEAYHQRVGVLLPAVLLALGAPLVTWWWLRRPYSGTAALRDNGSHWARAAGLKR